MQSSASALVLAAVVCVAGAATHAQRHPRDREIHDPDTTAWWHTTEALSGDAMQGRDTGSPAYERAAGYVAARFKAAGWQPAGDRGTYFQTVPMHEISVLPQGTTFTLVPAAGAPRSLEFLQQITIAPAADLPPRLEGALTFRGYCGKEALEGVAGRIVVCFGTQRQGLPGSAVRIANVRDGHAIGIVSVDDPFFTIEPPRWPFAYARTVGLRSDTTGLPAPAAPRESAASNESSTSRARGESMAVMRISAAAFATLLIGSGQDARAILKRGGAREPLPNFEIPSRLRVQLHVVERDISSPNVLAMLPGASPALRSQYVVVSAHLDGYGFGTPVKGDNLYNGTLDDAAYVALLIQMADDIKSRKLQPPQRSLLFAAFTGEEKGLLGSSWFVEHPTVPMSQLAADVNLDQLRPLFPLRILTAEALTDTSLGESARRVAEPLHIEIRADAEPERNLLRRADQYPFLLRHVPAISFIFGYDPGTEAERRYREWYQVRYHRPQDDPSQPVDFGAAGEFNDFLYRLVEAVADDPQRPEIFATSEFAAPDP